MRTETYTYFKSITLIPSISIDWRTLSALKRLTAVWITFTFLWWTIEMYLWEINDEDHINMIHDLDKKISNVRDK
jgi:hypothetical protein